MGLRDLFKDGVQALKTAVENNYTLPRESEMGVRSQPGSKDLDEFYHLYMEESFIRQLPWKCAGCVQSSAPFKFRIWVYTQDETKTICLGFYQTQWDGHMPLRSQENRNQWKWRISAE
jgi:hypothetical protein